MNYYPRHLGDYAKGAGHLSLLEHGVYTLLLDRYYATELPIPDGQAHRLVRARSNEEQAAVDAVLSEFFTLSPKGWLHSRCDAEIAKYLGKSKKAQASANTRWDAARTHSDGNADADAMRTHSDGSADAVLANSQEPITSNQARAKARACAPAAGSRLAVVWTLPDDWRAWALKERPELDVIDEADRFRDHWHGKAGKDARKADWLATWRNWIRNARGAASRDTPTTTGGRHATTRTLSAVDRIAANVQRAQQHDAERGDNFIEGQAIRLAR